MQINTTHQKESLSGRAAKLLQTLEDIEIQLVRGLDSNEMTKLISSTKTLDMMLKKVFTEKMSKLMQNEKGSDKNTKNTLIAEVAELAYNKKNFDRQLKKVVAGGMGGLIQDTKNFDKHLKKNEVEELLQITRNFKNNFKGLARGENEFASVKDQQQRELSEGLVKPIKDVSSVVPESKTAGQNKQARTAPGEMKHSSDTTEHSTKASSISTKMTPDTKETRLSFTSQLHIALDKNGSAELIGNNSPIPSTTLESPMVSMALNVQTARSL